MKDSIEVYLANIVAHYAHNWGGDFKYRKWPSGPLPNLVPHFTVLEYPPNASRAMWTYATCGMSDYTHASPVELHLFSSRQDDSIIELLSAVCYFHQVADDLDLGHTVNFGRPWQGNSEASSGLISLPYLDGPALEVSKSGQHPEVHFYWLIPITKAELKFKKDFGLAGLESKFDNDQFNYLDPMRKSVV